MRIKCLQGFAKECFIIHFHGFLSKVIRYNLTVYCQYWTLLYFASWLEYLRRMNYENNMFPQSSDVIRGTSPSFCSFLRFWVKIFTIILRNRPPEANILSNNTFKTLMSFRITHFVEIPKVSPAARRILIRIHQYTNFPLYCSSVVKRHRRKNRIFGFFGTYPLVLLLFETRGG